MLVGSTLPRPADDRPAGDLAFPAHGGDERIVAAGVENDQPQPLGAIGRRHQPLQRYRFVLGVAVAGEPRIDRDEVIGRR